MTAARTARCRLSRRGLLAAGAAASVTGPTIATHAADPDTAGIANVGRLLAVGAELDAIDRSSHPEMNLRPNDPWWKEYEAHQDALITEFIELTERLLTFHPRTLPGLTAKARAVAATIEQECFCRVNVPLGEDGEPHERLAWQFARDLVRLTTRRS